jgi:serine phosphatase RsbU (regulator of sigma subunit)/CHASE3 domain sensor protein
MHRLPIGQLVGLGFGLILFLALLIGLGGRIAYDISRRQSEITQTRGNLTSLTMNLKIQVIQRTDALRRYLDSGNGNYLALYQSHTRDYDSVYQQATALLRTLDEAETLQQVAVAEASFTGKAQEVLRLYDSGFPSAARFLWASEGIATQDNLIGAIDTWDQVQSSVGEQVINQARQTEDLAILLVSVFGGLALLTGVAASLLITRSIVTPISQLVKTVDRLSSDLTTRVDPVGPREVAFLGEAINAMAASLLISGQEIQQHKERLERELELASRIQASFLPTELPDFPGLELAVFWQSARELGGDFYTCLELDGGLRAIAIGDVNGKGAPAAMAGALAVGLLGAYAPAHASPETLLGAMNKELYARFSSNRMNVACCYAILNRASLRMTVGNAGCIYPYLWRCGKVTEIEVSGLPLGAWAGFKYTSQSVLLSAGDLVIFSSDGLVEARNEQGELFGFERLEAELRTLPTKIDAKATVNRLIDAVLTFTGNVELQDDLTLLVARVIGR